MKEPNNSSVDTGSDSTVKQHPGNTNRRLNGAKKPGFFIITVFLLITIAALLYLGSIIYRTNLLRNKIHLIWSSKNYTYDRDLGFAPKPGTSSDIYGVPVCYDDEGFRIPEGAGLNTPKKRPLVLALGDSFTYGDMCPAENTFPHIAGKKLNGTTLNAGGCSYGLSQMLLLAKKLIPEYKPDYVLAQYSPWLAERSMTPFGTDTFCILTNPYFAKSGNGGIFIYPVVFKSKIFDLPLKKYVENPGKNGWLSFLINVGIPLYTAEDINMLKYNIARFTGKIPAPYSDRDKIVKYTYEEMEKLCEQNGSKLVIVMLGAYSIAIRPDELPRPELKILKGLNGPVLVDAITPLYGRLGEKSGEAYRKEYCSWVDNPPRCVDEHPNKLAHEIIAEKIVKTITGVKEP
ncbi:MAG: hypothetical protein M1269_13070 [Chloroflexi bacterium]|nr:hypothetical protein [Chloroflexota bacterium]